MKKLLIALGVSAAVVSGSAMAEQKLSDTQSIKAHFVVNGTVTTNTCTLDKDAHDGYTINLDEVSQNELNTKNNHGEQFKKINLTDCPAAYKNAAGKVFSKVQLVALGGNAYTEDADKGLLKNIAKDTEKADNVYVRLLQSTDTPFKIGRGDDAGITKNLQLGVSDISFDIGAEYYRKNGESATAGKVQAYTTLDIVYK